MTYCIAAENVLRYEHKRNASRVDATNISATLRTEWSNTMSDIYNTTHSADSRQLSIFGSDAHDARPLPEIIASGGSGWQAFDLQYHDVDGKRYYAVQDWIAGVALSSETRKFWTAMKARLKKAEIELSIPCRQLKYRASNGKSYEMDFATDKGLYTITQYMDTNTGIRKNVLAYLVEAGVALDEMRRDPGLAIDAGIAGYKRQGKSDEWIAARTDGKIRRNEFTEALHDALMESEPHLYGRATDTLYLGLFDRTSQKLREQLQLPKGASLRNSFPALALAYTSIAEMVIAQKLGSSSDLTWTQAVAIIVTVAATIKPQIEATSALLGVDPVTSRALLDGRVQ